MNPVYFNGVDAGCDKVHPFLKWPGGKRWLISRYQQTFPNDYNIYIEPFLGGGSVFFHLAPEQAIIADINAELINTYRMMARNPAPLRAALELHQENHNAEYYYEMRNNNLNNTVEKAARFLYLNRTCFNGMYRVNRLGQFNVPIGTKQYFIDDVNLFEEYAQILNNAHIRKQDFVDTIRSAHDGDLVFADPPYTIAHSQNSFIKYNENLFSWKDQKRLLNALIRARDRGATVIATNAFYPELRQMYENSQFYTQELRRYSSISGITDGRGRQSELLISSFPLDLEE